MAQTGYLSRLRVPSIEDVGMRRMAATFVWRLSSLSQKSACLQSSREMKKCQQHVPFSSSKIIIGVESLPTVETRWVSSSRKRSTGEIECENDVDLFFYIRSSILRSRSCNSDEGFYLQVLKILCKSLGRKLPDFGNSATGFFIINQNDVSSVCAITFVLQVKQLYVLFKLI